MVFDSTTGTQMKVKINNFWMFITLLFCWSQRACTVIPVDQLYRFTLSGPHQEPIYSRPFEKLWACNTRKVTYSIGKCLQDLFPYPCHPTFYQTSKLNFSN